MPYIRGRAFAHCDQIKSIFIPSLVTDIGAEAFRWCQSLRSVSFAPDSRLEHIERPDAPIHSEYWVYHGNLE
jgi:hypothetical protein